VATPQRKGSFVFSVEVLLQAEKSIEMPKIGMISFFIIDFLRLIL
jgi:hypothetical protein